LKCPSAVGRTEYSARRVRAVRVAERGDEQPIRILWVDVDHGDHLRVVEPEVRPGLSGVRGLVDAVANREVRPDDAGAGPDVYDVRIGWRDGDRPDRTGWLAVEERNPGRPVVCRAPDAAVVETDVEHVRLTRHTRKRASTTGARRADLAPMQVGQRILRRGDAGQRKREEQSQRGGTAM